MSSTLPTTREPAPRANSVSVVAGVSEMIFDGRTAIVTAVPSSSVTVNGKATGEGLGAVGGAVAIAVGALAVGDGPPWPAHAEAASATVTMSARRRGAAM